MPRNIGFEEWMLQVNAIIERRCGLCADDLADICYRDMYEDGCSPAKVAGAAIRFSMSGGL